MKMRIPLLAGLAAAMIAPAAPAQKPAVYPAKAQTAQQQQQQALNTYYKFYAACMEGRGYSVK
jgi:hypothetical protein